MASSFQSEVIEEINRRVDPQALLEKISFHPDSISLMGSKLKAFCPIHAETKLKTFLIDLNKRTFQCLYRPCPGHKGGSLVEFFGLYQGIASPLQAAFALAKFTGVELDESLLGRLCVQFVEEGRRALDQGRLEEATEHVVHALEVSPEGVDSHLLASQLAQVRGAVGEAIEHAQRAAALAESQGDSRKAIEIIAEQVLDLLPEDEENLLHLADLHESVGDIDRCVDLLVRVARVQVERGESASSIPLFARVLSHRPDRYDVRLALAGAFEAVGETGQAGEHFLIAADLLEQDDRPAEAMDTLRRIREIDPANWTARDRIAEHLLREGREEEFRSELLSMAGLAVEQGEEDRAEHYARQVLETGAASLEAREILARVLYSRGDLEAYAREKTALADLYAGEGRSDQVIEALRAARVASPDDVEIRERLTNSLLSAGDRDGASSELFDLGLLHFQQGRTEEGAQTLSRLSSLADDDLSIRRKVIDLYVEAGFQDRASEECEALAGTLGEEKRWEEALEFTDQGLGFDAESVGLRRLRIEALSTLGREAEAVVEYEILVHRLLETGDDAGAEEAIEAALQLAPEHVDLQQTLVDLYLRLERKDEAVIVLRNLTRILHREKEVDRLIGACDRLLALSPEDRETRALLADQYLRKGLAAEASEEFERVGDQSAEAGDFGEARRYYERVIDIDPGALEVLRKTADLVAENESLEAAKPFFRRILNVVSGQDNAEALDREYRAQLERDAGWSDLRRGYAEWLIEQGRREDAYQQLVLLAENLVDRHGDLEGAALVYLQLIAYDPKRLEFRLGLGRLYERQGDIERAAETKRAAVDLLLAAERREEALDLLEEVVRLTPSDEAVRLRLVDFLEEGGDAEAAIAQLEEIALLRRSGDREEENVEVYRRILGLNAEHLSVRRSLAEALEAGSLPVEASEQWLALAESLEKAGRSDEAVKVCRHVVEIEPEEAAPRLRLARLFESTGNLAELKEEHDGLVALYRSQGALPEAAGILRRMIELNPDDLTLPERLGRLLEEMGEREDACILYYETAIRHRQLGEGAMARALLVRVKTIRPEERDPRSLLAEVCEDLEDLRAAAREYLDLAQMGFEGGDAEAAERHADQVTRLAGEDWDLVIELAHVCSRSQRHEHAVKQLATAIESALNKKDAAGGLALTREAIRLSPESRALRERRVDFLLLAERAADAAEEYRALADLAEQESDKESAALYVQALVELAPSDIPAHQHLAELMIQLDDKGEAIRELRLVAGLQADEGRLDHAIETAGRILDLEPGDEEIRSLRADYCTKAGRTEEAAEDLDVLADQAGRAGDWEKAENFLRRILKLSPDSLDAVRKLAGVILSHRSLEEARPVLQRRLEIASSLLTSSDLAAEYKAVLETDPGNPDFHLEYARVLREQDDRSRALVQFRRAADLWEDEKDLERSLEVLDEILEYAPDSFSTLERKGRLYLRLEKPEEARRAFVSAGEGMIEQGTLAEGVGAFLQALQIDPDDEALLERVGSLYEESGAVGQARDLYLRIANLRERRGATEETLPVFEKLLSLSPGDLETRRRFADALETLGDAGRAVEQWLLFAERAEQQNEAQKAISACSHIKEIDPSALENRRRLVGLFRGIGEAEAAKREIAELADLYEGAGKADEVELLLLEVATEVDPADRAFRRRLAEFYAGQGRMDNALEAFAALARLCLDEEDTNEALDVYRRVLELAPEDFDTRQRIVEILESEGRSAEAADEALGLAQAYLENEAMDSAELWADKAIVLDRNRACRVLQAAELFFGGSREEEARRILLRRAEAFLKSEDPASADQLLATAQEWYPDSAEAAALRVESLCALGNEADALEMCRNLARMHREGGDSPAEERAWKRALELDAEDVETHEGLIGALESQGGERLDDAVQALLKLSALHRSSDRLKRAIDCQRRCLDLASHRDDVRESLAQMLLDVGDWPSALEEYLDLAQRRMDAGDPAKARTYFEKVLELDHENLDALRTLLRIAREQKDHGGHIRFSESLASIFVQASALGDAIQCYRDLLEFSPDHLEGWETLGALLEQEERADEAVEVWSRLTEQYELEGDTIAAIENLQKIERHRPEDLATARRLADLTSALGDASAVQRYERVIELCEQAGDLDQATEVAALLAELAPNEPATHRTLARLNRALGRRAEALEALARAISLHESRGETDQAIGALSDLLEIDPENLPERERYAKALEAAGEEDQALEQLFLLADAYEKQEDLQSAVSRCRDALAIDTSSLDAHTRLHRYYVGRGDVALALAESTWLADYYAERDNTQKVREYLESGLELDPQNMALLERLAEMHMEAGQLDEATNQYLRIAEAALVRGDINRAMHAMELARDCSPDDVEIRRNLAEIFVRQGDNTSARSEFFEVARLYLAQGLVADARGTLDALIIQTPKDIELRERIAGLYVSHGIPELAALQYVELARLRKQANDPEGVIRYCGEALTLKPRTIEAKELQVEAQIQADDLGAAYETYSDLADLYSQTGQPERAANCLRPMMEMQPDAPEPRQRLIDILQRLNRPDEAVEEMRELASIHATAGSLSEAVATYRCIIETRPDDTRARLAYIKTYSQVGSERDLVDDYIKLAGIFVAHNDVRQATEAYEKALTIAPEIRANREAFVEFLLSSIQLDRAQEEADALSAAYLEEGENREAMGLLQKILKLAPDNTNLRLRLAEAHNRLNARGMALKELRLVAKAYEKQGNADGLITTFREILDIDPQNVETRQQLIELLEGRKRIEESAEQRMQLADVYVGRGLLDLARDEYRSLTRVQPENVTGWSYLVGIREQLEDREGLADDYLALGQLQENLGEKGEALDSYRKAVAIDPAHLEARRQYIETYKESGKEADLIDDYLTLADILLARNQVDEAVEIYSHVMRLDPANETARQKLVDTQARRAGLATGPASTAPKSAAAAKPETAAEVSEAFPPSSPLPPEITPVETGGEEESEEMQILAEEEAGLDQVVANYQDILQVNPQNANVRLKLADLYEQLGKGKEALSQLVKASEIFFQKSELNMCVTVCERILSKDPSNGKVRERLSKAVLKRDAFKALESAILFSDQAQTDTDPKRLDSRDTL